MFCQICFLFFHAYSYFFILLTKVFFSNLNDNVVTFFSWTELSKDLWKVSFFSWKIRKCWSCCRNLFTTMESFQAWWGETLIWNYYVAFIFSFIIIRMTPSWLLIIYNGVRWKLVVVSPVVCSDLSVHLSVMYTVCDCTIVQVCASNPPLTKSGSQVVVYRSQTW